MAVRAVCPLRVFAAGVKALFVHASRLFAPAMHEEGWSTNWFEDMGGCAFGLLLHSPK